MEPKSVEQTMEDHNISRPTAEYVVDAVKRVHDAKEAKRMNEDAHLEMDYEDRFIADLEVDYGFEDADPSPYNGTYSEE